MPGPSWNASAAMFLLMWLTMMVAIIPILGFELQRYGNGVGWRGRDPPLDG